MRVSLSELSSARDKFWFSLLVDSEICGRGRFRVIESVDPDQEEVSGQDGPSLQERSSRKKQEECCAVKKKAKISVCSVLGL